MSGTVAASRLNISKLMRDLPVGNDRLVNPDSVIASLDSWYAQVGAIFGYADTWTTAAVTLVSGTLEYALPTAQYQTVSIIRRTDDGRILQKRSMEDLESLRQSSVAQSGSPTDYTLYEDASQIAKIRLFPTPDGTNPSLDMYASTSTTVISSDSDTLGLSRDGLNALELLVAAELLAGCDPDKLKARGISPGLSQALQARGQMMMDTEKERRAQFRRTDRVRRVRY